MRSICGIVSVSSEISGSSRRRKVRANWSGLDEDFILCPGCKQAMAMELGSSCPCDGQVGDLIAFEAVGEMRIPDCWG